MLMVCSMRAGSKIVFNGAGKIFLGDGKSGKTTTLSFEEGKDGVSTFLPGKYPLACP